jgi:putative membrane protein
MGLILMKRINKEVLVQFLFFVLTAAFIIYALISRKVNKYVHPRFYFGLWISSVVLLIFGVSVLLDRKKGRHNANLNQYLLLLLPLLFSLLFPPMGTGNADILLTENENKPTVNSNANTNQSEKSESPDQSTNSSDNMQYENQDDEEDAADEDISQNTIDGSDSTVNEKNQDKQKKEDMSKKYTDNEVDGVYVINDDIFSDWYIDVYNNLDNFIGKKYQFLAQVFSMDGLKENQFLAGRYFMVCCAADLEGYGVLCESDKRSDLKEDQWITVTATIESYKYQDMLVPILSDVTISEAKAPKVEYIYYNY